MICCFLGQVSSLILMVEECGYVLVLVILLSRLLLRGQILPLDDFLNQLDVVLVDLRSSIHQAGISACCCGRDLRACGLR